MTAHAIQPGAHPICTRPSEPERRVTAASMAKAQPPAMAQAMTRDEIDRELAALHEPGLGWALACCRWDRTRAEDALHASYLKVLEGRAKFGGRSSFRTWLFGVIRTTAHERRRTRLRRLLALEREHAGRAQATAPRQELSPDAARLRRELESLPARQREVLHLCFYGELTIREAAEVMKVSLGTARTHYERGKRRLRERLGIGEPHNG